MAMSLQAVAKTGTVKKITASNLYRTMSADAAYYSSSATTVAVNDYIAFGTDWYLILQAGCYVDLKFMPDTGSPSGQGTSIPGGFDETEVIDLLGTCYGLRAEKATLDTTKVDAYSHADKFSLSIGDKLRMGDMAVCNNTGSSYITLRFTAPADGSPYVAIPAIPMYSDDK